MRRIRIVATAVALAAGLATAATAAAPQFPELIAFSAAQGELPEGVAVDKVGNVYVSLDPLGRILKFSPAGEQSVLADFGSPGGLGLAVDARGNVYVAREVPNNGVYRVDPDGNATLVPGTDAILFPNGLAFDKRGNLFISETFSADPPLAEYPACDIGFGPFFGRGGIWKVPPGGSAELWLRHELLTGLCVSPIPFPIGANGIAYHHGALLVVNTEKALLVRVPVQPDGEPGSPQVVATVPDLVPPSPFGPPALDGLALDVHGNAYVPVINQSRIVRISADGTSIVTVASSADGLDFPASVAFGTGKGERRSLFVTNFAIGPPGGAGPALLKLAAADPGLPLP